jgi:hypothetical protein
MNAEIIKRPYYPILNTAKIHALKTFAMLVKLRSGRFFRGFRRFLLPCAGKADDVSLTFKRREIDKHTVCDFHSVNSIAAASVTLPARVTE